MKNLTIEEAAKGLDLKVPKEQMVKVPRPERQAEPGPVKFKRLVKSYETEKEKGKSITSSSEGQG